MKILLFICLIGLLVLSLGCDTKQASAPSTTMTTQQSPEDFIFGQKGKVIVALLGIEGCPGTKLATEVLAKMSKDCPKDLVLARLDVPLQVESPFKPLTNWNYNYYHAIDTDHKIANRLEFFYYPTLYIIDRDGEVRYSGSCNEEKLKSMVVEILREKPGAQKKIYTPPMLAVGASAPVFQSKNINDEDMDLRQVLAKGPVLLLFTSVGCPFSKDAAQKIPNLEKEFAGKDFTIVIIEKGSNSEAVNSLYKKMAFNGIVILDKDNTISQKYNVEPVPFYFVIGQAGKITDRGPYTETSVKQALNTVLGMKAPEPKEKSSPGAG